MYSSFSSIRQFLLHKGKTLHEHHKQSYTWQHLRGIKYLFCRSPPATVPPDFHLPFNIPSDLGSIFQNSLKHKSHEILQHQEVPYQGCLRNFYLETLQYPWQY